MSSSSISDPFTQLSEFPSSIRNLQAVLSLGWRIGRIAPILYEARYKTLLFHLAATRNVPEQHYQSNLIALIREYEQTHDNGFIPTLRSYLLNRMDLDAVAEEHGIHKNTVSYRLNQISKQFGIDLKDCGVITELYLAMFTEIIKDMG